MSSGERPAKAGRKGSERRQKAPTAEETLDIGADHVTQGIRSMMAGDLQAAREFFKSAAIELDPSAPGLTVEEQAECKPVWQLSKAMEMTCEGMGKLRTMDYERAKDDLTRARSELRAATGDETSDDEIKFLVGAELREIDYLLPVVDATLRATQRDYDGSSKAFGQAVQSIEATLQGFEGNPTLEPLASFYSGLRLYYSALGKVQEAQYRSDTGESDRSVQLCEQASSELTEAKVHFIESSVSIPQAQVYVEQSGNLLAQFLPIYMSQYKNASSLQQENQRLKQEVAKWEGVLQDAFKRPVNVQQFQQVAQTFQTLQVNVENSVRANLEDLASKLGDLGDGTDETKAVEEEVKNASKTTGETFLPQAKKALDKVVSYVQKAGLKAKPLLPIATAALLLLRGI